LNFCQIERGGILWASFLQLVFEKLFNCADDCPTLVPKGGGYSK
jgi:hypothetical protein